MKEKIFNALLWALSAIVIFIGVMLSVSGFYGVFVLLAGIVLNPSVASAMRLKRWVSVVGFLVLFLAAIMSTPKADAGVNPEAEADAGTSAKAAVEVAPEPDTSSDDAQEAVKDEGKGQGGQAIHLNAGDWIVGVDIEAGRYTITTAESLCILKVRAAKEEYPHINAYLEAGDGGYTGTLEDGDLLHCDEPIDLMPYQP